MLLAAFLILPVILTGVVYLAAPTVSPWWIPLFLVGFHLATILVYLVVVWTISLCLSKKPPKKPNVPCMVTVALTAQWLTKLFRIRPKFVGFDQIPTDGPFVVVSNHLSATDPMLLLSGLDSRKLLMISKEQNFKAPIAGPFIRRAGYFAIDRENPMNAMRTLKQAGEFMKEFGVNIVIYPEGTRSKTGELQAFKEGAFLLAKRAEAPIVVVTTKGTYDVSRRFPWRSTKAEVKVQAVVDRETVKNERIADLCERVHAIVEKGLQE